MEAAIKTLDIAKVAIDEFGRLVVAPTARRPLPNTCSLTRWQADAGDIKHRFRYAVYS
jgi:hypothetical protein